MKRYYVDCIHNPSIDFPIWFIFDRLHARSSQWSHWPIEVCRTRSEARKKASKLNSNGERVMGNAENAM